MDDFLEELVAELGKRNPELANVIAEEEQRRKIGRKLAKRREQGGLSQTVVAARMGTSASVVSKLESGADVKLSTLQRYLAALNAK